jgi:hypothetical protein
LHVLEKGIICAIDDSNAASGDITVDGGDPAEENIIPHDEGILSNPIPRGIKVAGFERLEDGLNTRDVGVSVFVVDCVELGLESLDVGLLSVGSTVTLASIQV